MMSRKRELNEAIRLERRQQILAVAIPLFAGRGYDATGMSEVAQAAGLSHGSIFRYFPTKEALFQAAVLEPLAETEAHYREILRGEGSPLARIQRLVREQILTLARQQSYVRLAHHTLGQRERFAEIIPEIFAYTARFCAVINPIIAEGQRTGELLPGEPGAIATAYFAYLNGVILVSDPPGSPYFEETLAAMIQMGIRIFGPTQGGH